MRDLLCDVRLASRRSLPCAVEDVDAIDMTPTFVPRPLLHRFETGVSHMTRKLLAYEYPQSESDAVATVLLNFLGIGKPCVGYCHGIDK